MRFERHELICTIAGELMQQGHLIFCPVAHSHSISLISGPGIEWKYWAQFCLEMIRRTDELWIATISGWNDSHGISEEVAIAHALGKPVYLLNPETFDRTLYLEPLCEKLNR
jgi:hypothetical protein